MLGGIFDLVVAVHAPLPNRCYDFEVRREGGCGHVEAHLVVSFAGAAMCNCGRAFAACDLDHHRRDQWPSERGRKWVFLLVYGSCLKRRPDEELQEWGAAVGDIGCRRAGLQGAGLDRVKVLLLTQVDGERDHVPAQILQPADGHGGVESAGIGEDQLLVLLGGTPPFAAAGQSPSTVPPSRHAVEAL